MILSAHQPAYLPWLGYFAKAAAADLFCVFDIVQFERDGFDARNRIKAPNGPLWLRVPTENKGHRATTIRDIRINNRAPWRRKHWRSIEANYRKAPHWERYAGFLEEVYAREWDWLVDLNDHLFHWFLGELGIDTPVVYASDYDFRGRKSDLVLDMCVKLEATEYIFGAMGRDYADVPAFEAAGVRVRFQDYEHPTYPQLYGAFESHLSVLDLLMNVGPGSLDVILGR